MDSPATTLRRWPLFLMIALGTGYRLWYSVAVNPLDYLYSDMRIHWANGAHLLDMRLWGALHPLLFQVWVWLLRELTGDNRVALGLSFGILSALTPWLYYRAGRALGLSKTGALVGWAILAWDPTLLVIYHYVMMETLLLPLVGLALWMTGRYQRKQTTAAFLVMTGCWLLAAMTKPTAVPPAILAAGYAWWTTGRKPQLLLGAAVLVAAGLLPNTLRTYHYLGFAAPLVVPDVVEIQQLAGAETVHLTFHGLRGDETIWVSSPNCRQHPLEPLSNYQMDNARTDAYFTIDRANGHQDWLRARRDAAESSSSPPLAKRMADNVVNFLFAPSWPDTEEPLLSEKLNYDWRWTFLPLVGLVTVLGLRRSWQMGLLPFCTLGLTFFLMFQTLSIMEGRYRKIAEPLLILSALSFLGGKTTKQT